MSSHFWPSENAIGKRFKQVLPGMDGDWITVIGVVKDVVYDRDGKIMPVFYSTARQWHKEGRELIVRTDSDPQLLTAAVRQTLQSIDPTLPRFEISTVDDRLAEQDRPRSFQTELIGIFACLAVVLAATGLYGLMAYSVEQRTKEIGIRMAMGWTRACVARLVLKQSATWGGLGMVAGVAGAVLFGRALSASLYGLATTDPLTPGIVIAVLGVVMVLASAALTIRAISIEPIAALRQE
jgi:putative ABC transport system permease protein